MAVGSRIGLPRLNPSKHILYYIVKKNKNKKNHGQVYISIFKHHSSQNLGQFNKSMCMLNISHWSKRVNGEQMHSLPSVSFRCGEGGGTGSGLSPGGVLWSTWEGVKMMTSQ